jgi:hypothetical protein
MPTIEREALLSDLSLVRGGLSRREFTEQSSRFVFRNGWVMTFNDEVACRKRTSLNIEGAIDAKTLMEILSKMDQEVFEVRENDQGHLEFRGKGERFKIVKESRIYLPINVVERPERWVPIVPEFRDAIKRVLQCVSDDQDRFLCTCVHIGLDCIEAFDNAQLMRFYLKSGFEEEVLVRGLAMSQLSGIVFHEAALTPNWLHFRQKEKDGTGLIFSCRRFHERFPSLDKFMVVEGEDLIIPKGLKATGERATVFASETTADPLLKIILDRGRLHLSGEGLSGSYENLREVDYQGSRLEFYIRPELLSYISENYNQVKVSDRRLKARGENWAYVTALVPNEETNGA